MKPSIYNHFVNINDREFVYNSLTNQYAPVSEEIKGVLNCDEISDSPLTQTLFRMGYIVNDGVCEKDMVKTLFFTRRHSARIYNLVINTTLDCNLGCWYCYESHPRHSFLPLSLVDTILEHLRLKAKTEPFELLKLSFFGGEPMMNFKAIKKLLDGVKKLSEESEYKVFLAFVTNGTFLHERYIEILKPFNTRFQITIDGDEKMHNSIRVYKNKVNGCGSYRKILEGLKLFNDADADFHFTIRINYDNNVLLNIDQLINNLDFLNRRKAHISLHQIWQYEATTEDNATLLKTIERINNRRFTVDTFSIYPNFEPCYADNYNHAVINYNGQVFKCTARDFVTSVPEGRLNSEGFIEWNVPKLNERLSTQMPAMCEDCSLLPSCSGICSQQLMESNDINKMSCPYENRISKENIILLNLKQKLIAKKNETV